MDNRHEEQSPEPPFELWREDRWTTERVFGQYPGYTLTDIVAMNKALWAARSLEGDTDDAQVVRGFEMLRDELTLNVYKAAFPSSGDKARNDEYIDAATVALIRTDDAPNLALAAYMLAAQTIRGSNRRDYIADPQDIRARWELLLSRDTPPAVGAYILQEFQNIRAVIRRAYDQGRDRLEPLVAELEAVIIPE